MICAACARTLILGLAGITRSTRRALLQFVKSNGATNSKKDQLLSSDEEDEHRSRRGPPSWHVMPESDTKRKQHLWLPSLEDRTPWSGLVGLMARGTPRATKTIIPPMSFSDALNKASPVEEAEKAREWDIPCTQTLTTPQQRKMDDEDEEEEKVELHMPGSFDFGDHDSRVARRACAGPPDPFGAVLGNLFWRMQLRWWCRQGHPFLNFFVLILWSQSRSPALVLVLCSLFFCSVRFWLYSPHDSLSPLNMGSVRIVP